MGIDIKTGKVVEPKIYAYTTPQVTTNDGWIKIGYTERDVETRIREQTHTAAIQTESLFVMIYLVINRVKVKSILYAESKPKL